jgi:hypothetical protein
VGERFVCFSGDKVSFFQGCHIGMTFQLKEKYSPYMIGQHCMAHKTNLTSQALSNLPTYGVQVGGFTPILVCLFFKLP